MYLNSNSHIELYDKPISLTCPHCNVVTGVTLLSIPNYSYLMRFRPSMIGMGYMCGSCKEPVFLKFKIKTYESHNHRIQIDEIPVQVEFPKVDFEYKYVPEPVGSDFKEALICYSVGAFNGFASMCRRTIQSLASHIGVKGKDKVQKQINELKEITDIDEETFSILKQIILDGHDGAHPHLPALSKDRADILLELIKDVIYQLYVRRGKLKEAAELRKRQIQDSK